MEGGGGRPDLDKDCSPEVVLLGRGRGSLLLIDCQQVILELRGLEREGEGGKKRDEEDESYRIAGNFRG